MWIYWLTFLFSVHADTILMPEKCLLKKTFPCTIQTQGKHKIILGKTELYFSNNSLIEIRSEKNIFLARGNLWALSKSEFTVSTVYGQFQSPNQGGEYWISTYPDKNVLNVFSGFIDAQPKGGEVYEISKGNHISLSSIDYKQGACYASRVTVLNFSDHLRNFGKVFPFGKISVEEHLYKVAGAVLTASSQESNLLKKQVARQLASDLEMDVRLKAQREAATKLEIYLKKLFKEKSNYEDQ
jgi:hypothetical protein